MTPTCRAQAASSQTHATILTALLSGWLMEACFATSAEEFVLVASPYNFRRSTKAPQLEKKLKKKLRPACTVRAFAEAEPTEEESARFTRGSKL